ncbi:hypothetical protein CCOS865_02501 [Pseudomonas reidholzensis]|uniref:Lipoprotein n=1 Tax=Pseudomonas reidholzensis TaxID=1785162 RepID=A0A383RTN5_9PSED|nr:hypothetical protein [Pseudomonas reidholzensis]SYX90235.1 hypothetical protein CCOS865_02501 [Pseudomonas reidholzensis]
MFKFFVTLSMIAVSANVCLASEAEDQATAFAKIYAALCVQNVADLPALRDKLSAVPSLPPEKAAVFLAGNPGDAWPVPDKQGTFVLALPSNKNLCAVHARRASPEKAIKLFTGLVSNPPAPFSAVRVKDEQGEAGANGATHTVAYEWSVPDAKRKILFTLTTNASESAPLQALGSVAVISR